MSYAVQYDAEAGLITIEITGRINIPLVRKLGPEVVRIAQEHHCFLVLNDAREATPSFITMELYDLPKIIQEIAAESATQVYRFKRALVVSKDIDDFTFFETVSRNRGQNVMLFRDVDAARKWLLGK
jgi:hypothetical protein